MPILHLRLTADDDAARTMINLISSLDGIERVEEVGDLMPHMDDEDSSSAGLPDDIGPGIHSIEVATSDEEVARKVRNAIGDVADELHASVEYVDEF